MEQINVRRSGLITILILLLSCYASARGPQYVLVKVRGEGATARC